MSSSVAKWLEVILGEKHLQERHKAMVKKSTESQRRKKSRTWDIII
jgi:hypothetical protein